LLRRFNGQSKTYAKYSLDAFLLNKVFSLFKEYQSALGLNDKMTFDHGVSCDGLTVEERRVWHPFVTTENWWAGYHLYEGAIYVMTNECWGSDCAKPTNEDC
jgi:hypothetical protein